MGDLPYAIFLPWVFFAVVARHDGEGVVWGAVAALIAAITLLVTTRHPSGDARNTLAGGAIAWFIGLGLIGLVVDEGAWMSRNARTLSALGFVVISLISIAYRPATEYYSRAHVLPRLWHTHGFARLNYQLTLLWAVVFLGIAASHYTATTLRIDEAYTVFNWVVPISLCALGAHFAKTYWFDFQDELELEEDPLRTLGMDYSDDWDHGL
jgi:hypothetical protein